MPSRLLVTLCTYNERENLVALLPEIWNFAPEADVVVVDDNSPDGTGPLLDEWKTREPRLHVLHRPAKLGLGTATMAGLKFAVEQNYDFVCNLDADFSHNPRYLPDLLAAMETADVAIGSRYVSGGGIVGWSLKRHFMSRGINWYARLVLGLRTRDNSGAFRCYRVEKLKQLDFNRFLSRGYAIQEELLFRCRKIGCRFAEIPIIFEERRYGESKIRLSEGLSAGWLILRMAFH